MNPSSPPPHNSRRPLNAPAAVKVGMSEGAAASLASSRQDGSSPQWSQKIDQLIQAEQALGEQIQQTLWALVEENQLLSTVLQSQAQERAKVEKKLKQDLEMASLLVKTAKQEAQQAQTVGSEREQAVLLKAEKLAHQNWSLKQQNDELSQLVHSYKEQRNLLDESLQKEKREKALALSYLETAERKLEEISEKAHPFSASGKAAALLPLSSPAPSTLKKQRS